MQFGRYRDALDLLEDVQTRDPSRDVFNNLGYVHLRLAVTCLRPELAYDYWLPALADLHPPLARLTLRAPGGAQPRSEWRDASSLVSNDPSLRVMAQVMSSSSAAGKKAAGRKADGGVGSWLTNEHAVLAIDHITTMVVLRNVAESTQTLVRCCSQPQDKISVAVGELWRYENWIAGSATRR